MRNKSSPKGVRDYKSAAAIVLSVLLLSSVLAIAGSGNVTADAEELDENQVIISQSADPDNVVAASGSNRFVVWQDNTPGNYDIFFKRSTDNGATWKATVNLSNNAGESKHAQLVVEGAYVYVIWVNANAGGNLYDVYFRRSSDNGATWGPKVNISANGNSVTFALAVSGQYVYIAFPSAENLLFKRSTNHGATFGGIVTLTGNFDSNLEMATSGAHVYVAWVNSEYAPVLRHSSNNGSTWGSTTGLPGSYYYGIDNLSLAATGSYVYAVWQEAIGCNGETEILFSRSTNNGAAWEDYVSLAGCFEGLIVQNNAMAVSGNRIFVFYSDMGDIFVKSSTDNGANWKARVNLSNNPGSSGWNGLALAGSNVYVIWTQLNADKTLADIFLRRSTDNGATWKAAKNISNNPGWSQEAQVAASGSNAYFMWEDTTDGDSEILFRRSTDGGATLKPTVKISNNDGSSISGRLLRIGTSILVVWTDDTAGNYEILHRRSIDNGATWKPAQNLSNNAGSSEFPQIDG